jgi:hypothetical protein
VEDAGVGHGPSGDMVAGMRAGGAGEVGKDGIGSGGHEYRELERLLEL